MSKGFEQAGFKPVLAIDHWKDALDTYAANHPGVPVLHADLTTVKPTDFDDLNLRPDLIVGGPPCQGFSISGKRDPSDPRNVLYQNFVDFVSFFRPSFFVMENVPNMASLGGGAILRAATDEFSHLGYSISTKILRASDYGVPQNRRRLFMVGLLGNNAFSFPEASHLEDTSKVTTFEAISDLPETTLTDGSPYPVDPKTAYQRLVRVDSTGVWNHQTTNHSQKTVDTIALVPDGGNYKDLPEHLQGTRRVNIAWTRYSSSRPSHTIDTGHRHHFHYSFNRIPTVRESARLQSFADSFVFSGTKTSQYKQVGNAVPPLLARAIGEALLASIQGGNN